MQPAGGRADVLGHSLSKCDDVVLSDLFDGFDAGDVESAAFANVTRGIGRYDSGSRHRLGSSRFYQQPRFITALVAPDAPHFRVRVACDHRLKSVATKDTMDTEARVVGCQILLVSVCLGERVLF